jgi:hypothetical protein
MNSSGSEAQASGNSKEEKLNKVEKYMDNNSGRKTFKALINGSGGRRRLGIVAAGIGLGAVLAYLFSKARGGSKERSPRPRVPDHIVDDRGTGQDKAAQILLNLRDQAFEASDQKLAVALGRPIEEVAAWHAGQELIDDDVVMKARGIAMNRGVRVE